MTPQIVFCNKKILEDHLVKSKIKTFDSSNEKTGIYKCGNINCDICNVLCLSNKNESPVTGKMYHINLL